MIKYLLIASFICFASCRLGIDHSEYTTTQQFKCLLKINQTYAIYRAWKPYGVYDANAAKSLSNAHSAGYKVEDLGVYLSPCFSTTKTPEQQVQEMIKQLDREDTKYSTIWLDIQTNPSTNCGWSTKFNDNCAFTQRLVAFGRKLGKKMGIYTSNYMWNKIMGGADQCNKFMNLPLWYAYYNNVQNFSDFRPFGGWTTPSIKQYKGTVTLCDVNGLDLNYSL